MTPLPDFLGSASPTALDTAARQAGVGLNINEHDARVHFNRTVASAPTELLLREEVANAIDETLKVEEAKRLPIRIFALPRKGWADKLCVLNGCRDIDPAEMHRRLTSLFNPSSETHFGHGVRLTGIAANGRGGLRYIISSSRGLFQVRLWNAGTRDKPSVMASSALEAVDPGLLAEMPFKLPEARPWVLLINEGESPETDTTQSFLASNDRQGWVMQRMFHQWMEIPEGVTIHVQRRLMGPGTYTASPLPFHTVMQRARDLVAANPDDPKMRFETVTVGKKYRNYTGVRITYILDETRKLAFGLPDGPMHFAALAYGSGSVEFYDLFKSGRWQSQSVAFGLMGVANVMSLIVQLPEGEFFPDPTRKKLTSVKGPNARVSLYSFADLVKSHRPKWVRDRVDQDYTPSALTQEGERYAADLFAKLGILRDRARPSPKGTLMLSPGTELLPKQPVVSKEKKLVAFAASINPKPQTANKANTAVHKPPVPPVAADPYAGSLKAVPAAQDTLKISVKRFASKADADNHRVFLVGCFFLESTTLFYNPFAALVCDIHDYVVAQLAREGLSDRHPKQLVEDIVHETILHVMIDGLAGWLLMEQRGIVDPREVTAREISFENGPDDLQAAVIEAGVEFQPWLAGSQFRLSAVTTGMFVTIVEAALARARSAKPHRRAA